MANMTKTRSRELLAEMKRDVSAVQSLLKPTPKWMQEQGVPTRSPEQVTALIEEHLNNIDGISALLREGLTDGEAY